MKWFALIGLLASAALLWMQLARAGELPRVGDATPNFYLLDQNGQPHTLKDFAGSWLVLYFYPKDDTPGCTTEACAFRDDLHQLAALGAQVVGVSVDDGQSHAQFAEKYHLPFPLLADVNKEVATRYGILMNLGVIKMAKRYTFLINPQGKVSKVYNKVETSKHSKEIIDDLKQLAGVKE